MSLLLIYISSCADPIDVVLFEGWMLGFEPLPLDDPRYPIVISAVEGMQVRL